MPKWHIFCFVCAKMAYTQLTNMPICVSIVMEIIMDLKEYRVKLGITIKEASSASGVPLRTYNRYENDEKYGNNLKRQQIFLSLREKFEVTKEKGIITIDAIRNRINDIFSKRDDVNFCYLFGSYAKGYANETSDVDLCISTTLTGLSFVGLKEEICSSLNKKVDLIRLSDLGDNIELVQEIMKEGIKIYG